MVPSILSALALVVAPSWLFPVSPPSTSGVRPTPAEFTDLFTAVDWHPDSHSPMPDVVAKGRPPEVFACGFCHLPAGQGRPENAPLAGLSAEYIERQVADMKSGARRNPGGDAYAPFGLMYRVAQHATTADVAAAAEYFSRQVPSTRVVVLERARVPKTHVVGWVYVANDPTADEPLGERLLEVAPDVEGHERRDETLRYVAYVPPGSIERGRRIAQRGVGAAAACSSCHGATLRGVGALPPLAGRSPTYLLRQLVGFKRGTRAGDSAAPMRAVVANMTMRDLIDAVAYAASLPP